MGFLLGKVHPLVEIVSFERAICRVQDDLGVPLEQESKGASGGANVDRLPQTVQHQHLLVQKRTHTWLARNVTHALTQCQRHAQSLNRQIVKSLKRLHGYKSYMVTKVTRLHGQSVDSQELFQASL